MEHHQALLVLLHHDDVLHLLHNIWDDACRPDSKSTDSWHYHDFLLELLELVLRFPYSQAGKLLFPPVINTSRFKDNRRSKYKSWVFNQEHFKCFSKFLYGGDGTTGHHLCLGQSMES